MHTRSGGKKSALVVRNRHFSFDLTVIDNHSIRLFNAGLDLLVTLFFVIMIRDLLPAVNKYRTIHDWP